MTLLVRFPAGWSRPVAGYYEAGEEFFLIEGDLRIGEVEYAQGDFGRWKPGLVRGPSSSLKGGLTLAHFEGPAQWKSAEERQVESVEVRLHYKEVAGERSPLGPVGCRLGSAWMLEDAEDAAAPFDADAEIFSVAESCWVWVPAGHLLPPLRGPCLCWLRESVTSR